MEIINHCVWLYCRFPLSLRDIEEMMAQRGVIVSYETIHQWCRKFGQSYANGLRRCRARPGDTGHLDEVFIKIVGKTSAPRVERSGSWPRSPAPRTSGPAATCSGPHREHFKLRRVAGQPRPPSFTGTVGRHRLRPASSLTGALRAACTVMFSTEHVVVELDSINPNYVNDMPVLPRQVPVTDDRVVMLC